MNDRWLEQLMRDVRAGHSSDLAGTRVACDISVSDRLINQVLAEKIGHDAAVREVTVRPEPGRARVTIKIARPSFLPPLSFVLTVEAQPQLPASPVLVLRVGMMPGVAALLGTGLSFMNVLPPGLRLEGDRLFVDVAAVLNDRGHGWVLPYLQSLNVAFEAGRLAGRIEVGS
jgi:hypothetical protein